MVACALAACRLVALQMLADNALALGKLNEAFLLRAFGSLVSEKQGGPWPALRFAGVERQRSTTSASSRCRAGWVGGSEEGGTARWKSEDI